MRRNHSGGVRWKIRWKDAAGRLQNTCFLIGFKSWFTPLRKEQAITDDWYSVLNENFPREESETAASSVCAEATPPAPIWPIWGWILVVIVALALLVVFPLVIVVWIYYGLGFWRRRDEEDLSVCEEDDPGTEDRGPEKSGKASLLGQTKGVTKRAGVAITTRFANAREATAKWMEPKEGGYSKLALTAFGFATLGWIVPFVGPIVGCILGWIALFQMRRSQLSLKGRGFALFAALLAPIVLVLFGFGGLLFALGELRPDWSSSPMALLVLAALVFVALRLLFLLARCRGLWAWNKAAGAVAAFLGTSLLLSAVLGLEFPDPMAWEGLLDLRDDEWRVVVAAIGATAGLLFAVSGPVVGGGSLLVALALGVAYLEVFRDSSVVQLIGVL